MPAYGTMGLDISFSHRFLKPSVTFWNVPGRSFACLFAQIAAYYLA